jgi:hypothetical protein
VGRIADNVSTARVLVLDIETGPNLAWVFSLFDQNIGLVQLEEVSTVMCFAAKWYGERKVMFHSGHHDGHEAMVQAAWDLMDEATAIVGYNSKNFDCKHLHREFILAGMPPPSPHKDIDLLTVVRSRAKFASGKLDHVAQQLGLGSKVKHSGFEMWRDCLAGDEAAWRKFKAYNIQDVRLTEALYERLMPWIKTHPHVGHFGGNPDGCPKCGSLERTATKNHTTGALSYPAYRCDDCGTPYRLARSTGTTGTRAI